MRDLTLDEVQAYAAALGLSVYPAEIAEVAHRLNALRDELAKLDALDLRSVVMRPPFFVGGSPDGS